MGLHSDEAPAETLAESAVIATNNEAVDELWSPHLVRTSASTSYGRHISSPPAGSQPAPVGDRGNPSGGASGRLRVGAPGAGGGKDGDSGDALEESLVNDNGDWKKFEESLVNDNGDSKKFEESLVNDSDLMTNSPKENGLDDDFQELMKTKNDENTNKFRRKEGSTSSWPKGTETKSSSKSRGTFEFKKASGDQILHQGASHNQQYACENQDVKIGPDVKNLWSNIIILHDNFHEQVAV